MAFRVDWARGMMLRNESEPFLTADGCAAKTYVDPLRVHLK
jgi:hypothetical protein